jgi:radical SAM superfamily enzyme YgiQ (UPF0313 family)
MQTNRRVEADQEDHHLQAAIVSTVAYRDVFGFPVTPREVHRYLHGVSCDYGGVCDALDAMLAAGRLIGDERYVALVGRDHLFDQRREREAIAATLWPMALAYGRLIATVPTVTMIGVTGSLTCRNTVAGCDIDFMVVTEPGTLWRTRALLAVAALMDGYIWNRLCVNYFVSERSLELEDKNLYVAQELAQMTPIFGLDTYTRLRAANTWADAYLPNAAGAPEAGHRTRAVGLVRALGRPIMRSALSQRLEDWESKRKLHKYQETNFLRGRYTKFTHESTGHQIAVRDRTLALHDSRLRSVVTGTLRVLFGQAYHLRLDKKLWKARQPYPPVGSLLAAAVARRAGHEVDVFDSMLSTTHEDWSTALDRSAPDVVVLFEDNFNYLTKMCLGNMRDAALAMVRMARETAATVLVCSSDASDHPGIYLDAGAHYVLIGEGEATLVELLEHVRNHSHESADRIAGIAYVERGSIVRTAPRPVLRKLDDLPLPAWDLIDFHRYRTVWEISHGYWSLNVATTRGCPYHCNWCAKPIWGQRYNARSPEHVVEEMAQLRALAHPDHVWFMDDIFGLKPGWTSRFAGLLEARGLKLPFKCLSRPDLLLRPGEIEALARAGCHTVWIGAESGSQKILDAMEKGTRIEQIEETTRRLREHGVRVGYFIQLGYPGETFADIRATVELLRRNLPDELGISVAYPLPGTPFYERVREQLGDKQHWRDSDDLAMLFRGPYATPFYRWLHRTLHWERGLHRALADVRAGRLRALPWRRRARRLAGIALHAAAMPFLWGGLYALARLPHRGAPPLRIERDRSAAAIPSPQPGD